MAKNNYYSATIDQLLEGKDSIIELAKVISYDSDRQVARVLTMTSNQYKDDVPVFFAALYQNTGIISPPVVNSTSMLLWGADRQPYLLPVQITTPAVQVDKGITNLNASPGIRDVLHTLKNLQGGEHVIRSLGGAYIFLKNLGDVELGTQRLHRLLLTEKDGAFDLAVERVRVDTGNSNFYLGPASMDSNVDPRTHLYFDLEEYSDESSKLVNTQDDIFSQILSDGIDEIKYEDKEKIFTRQQVHVFDQRGEIVSDDVDGSELFSEDVFAKGEFARVETLSKKGRKVIRTISENRQTEIAVSSSSVSIDHIQSDSNGMQKTSFKIDEDGRVLLGKDGRDYDLLPMLRWFYEERI